MKIVKTNILVMSILLIAGVWTANAQPGVLDTAFGSGGMNLISPPLADDGAYTQTWDMVVLNDGRIVALARAKDTAGTFQAVLVGYTADGQLDAAFGNGGFYYLPTTAYASAFARQLVKQNINGQERLVIAFGDNCGGSACVRVQRFTADGTVDASFGTGGTATVGSSGIMVTAAAVQTDQKILLGSPQHPLVRLNANGSPDGTFGRNGVASFNDTKMLISAIVPNSDGSILTAGSYLSTTSSDLYVARFTSGGRSDGAFGSQGKRVIDFAGMDDAARGLAVDGGGRVIAVGRANIDGPMSDRNGWDAVVVRLTSKGALDKTFGSNGKAAPLDIGGGEDDLESVAIQPNGKIVVTGLGTPAGNSSDILVARYNANGTLDTTFHGDGWNLTDVYGSGDSAVQAQFQSDPGCACSRLVVAGTASTGASPSPQHLAVLRYGL